MNEFHSLGDSTGAAVFCFIAWLGKASRRTQIVHRSWCFKSNLVSLGPGHETFVLISRLCHRFVCQMEMYTKENERIMKTLQLEIRKEAAVSQSFSVVHFTHTFLLP